MTEFPDPRVETLPEEPLQSGEQYFLDLGGNIKKGPSGHGSTCYCAPFIHRYECLVFQARDLETKWNFNFSNIPYVRHHNPLLKGIALEH